MKLILCALLIFPAISKAKGTSLKEADILGLYKMDSYSQPGADSPEAIVVSLRLQDEHKFTAYFSVFNNSQPPADVSGEWSLKKDKLTLKASSASCVYIYKAKLRLDVGSSSDKGFELVKKSGKITNFCMNVFVKT